MTNIFHMVVFSLTVATNWHDKGEITVDGKLKSVKVGIIETNHVASFLYEGKAEVVVFKREAASQPIVRMEPFTGPTNTGFIQWGTTTNYLYITNSPLSHAKEWKLDENRMLVPK